MHLAFPTFFYENLLNLFLSHTHIYQIISSYNLFLVLGIIIGELYIQLLVTIVSYI